MVKKKQIFRLQLVFTATVCKHKNKIVNRVLKLFSGQQMAAPPSPSNKCKRLEYFKRQNELRNCVATVCVCVCGVGGGVGGHKLWPTNWAKPWSSIIPETRQKIRGTC